MFDMSEVRFVKRVVVGTDDPAHPKSASDIEAEMALVNRCLTELPRGTIMSVEKSFTIVHVGEHQVVLQWLAYHLGWARRPQWLTD